MAFVPDAQTTLILSVKVGANINNSSRVNNAQPANKGKKCELLTKQLITISHRLMAPSVQVAILGDALKQQLGFLPHSLVKIYVH